MSEIDQKGTSRPASTTGAIACLWASLALTVINAALKIWGIDPGRSDAMVRLTGGTIGAVALVALNMFLIYRITFGKKWARITFIVFRGTGALMSLLFAFSHGGYPPGTSPLVMVQGFLVLAGVMLMFSRESNGWFRALNP